MSGTLKVNYRGCQAFYFWIYDFTRFKQCYHILPWACIFFLLFVWQLLNKKKKGWLDIVWHAKKGKWPIMYFWFQITSAFTNSHELLVYMSSTKKGDGDIINTLKHLKTRGWIIDIQAFTWITINSWYPSQWKNITKMMGWTWDSEQANFKIFLDRWVCIKCIKLLYGF